MTDKKEKKNILIGGLLVAIIAMAVGYAALAQQLTINGTAQVTSTWDVAITNISDGTPSNSAGVTHTVTEPTAPSVTGKTTATFDVAFGTPGDTMEYDVTIANNGSLDAKLANITTAVVDAEGQTTTLTEANGLNYEITIDNKDLDTAENSTLAGKTGDTTATSTVHVKVWWDAAATTIPDVTTKKLTLTLEYVQA